MTLKVLNVVKVGLDQRVDTHKDSTHMYYKTTMTSSNIYFILDRSGSMWNCVDDTLGGFNAFVANQKICNPNGTMSLILFGNDYSEIYHARPIAEVKNLTKAVYVTRGGTALLDAIGTTIKNVTDVTNIIIVILTDGHENSSTKFTKSHINDLITFKQSEGWQFVFLGANQDAISEGYKLGISDNSAMTFESTNVNNAFEGLSAAIGRQMTGESQNIEFTGLERMASCASPVNDTPDYAEEVRNLPDTLSF
jgi:hypothetical protein